MITIGRPTARPSVADRVLWQAASWCLSYPDETVCARLPQVSDAVSGLGHGAGPDALLRFLHGWTAAGDAERRREYVEVFDLDRDHALHLSYWTDGDTRRRGSALAEFKQEFRRSGFELTDDHELPDHLPIVLEFGAIGDPSAGKRLLVDYRPSLELLRITLTEAGSRFADVLVAICSTLPGESPKDRAAVQRLAGPPPVEAVGLEAYR